MYFLLFFCQFFTCWNSFYAYLDGENVAVTAENKAEYVKLYVDYVLNKSCQAHFNAFKAGFHKVDITVVLYKVVRLAFAFKFKAMYVLHIYLHKFVVDNQLMTNISIHENSINSC